MAITIATVTIAVAGCASNSSKASPPTSSSSAKAAVRHQQREIAATASITGGAEHTAGFVVTVPTVDLPESSPSEAGTAGYLALATDVAGDPGTLLGYVKVPEGVSRQVAVTVRQRLTSGRYLVLLFRGPNAPTGTNGAIASAGITLTGR